MSAITPALKSPFSGARKRRLGLLWFALGASALALVGCDGSHLLEPSADAEFGLASASGPKVNAPSSADAVAGSEGRIDVGWQDNSTNETGFEVHRSTSGPSGTFTLSGTTGAGVSTYSDGGLNSSTQYCYRVRAVRTYDGRTSYSDFSNTDCDTTPAPPAPSAPSGTSASPSNSSTADVTWTDNSSNEDGFRVERSATAAGPWEAAGTTGANAPSFTDGGRSSEQAVCYRVIAFNAGGDSGPSNADCTTPPAGPTSLTTATVNHQAIDLAWIDNSAVEDGYEVQRAGAEAGPYVVVANLGPNAVSHRDQGLSASTVYWYRVRGKKDGGFSDFSNVSSAATSPVLPANAPSGTNATPFNSTMVDVTWTDNSSSEDGFRVERSTDGGASWATAGTVGVDYVGFTDLGRQSEQQVCYRVFAFNGQGDSPPSNTDCTTPPAGPTGLSVTGIDLTWIDNSGVEDGYQVYRLLAWSPWCDGPACDAVVYYEYRLIAELPANSTSYSDTGVYGSEWLNCYIVVAKKDGGFSDFSNEACW